MDTKHWEILDLLKEECGELIVAASKATRWGLDSVWQGKSTQENLTQEVGDVLVLIELLVDTGVVTVSEVEAARRAKIEKLKQWSTIFEDS